ncbi:MAG: hypothetical protein ACTHJ0_13715 [Flavipsychrobacter sp.]
MGKIAKRILKIVGIIIVLFLATAILVPILFKDKIMAFAKKEMNNQLNATADFKDIGISLFRHFPHLSVNIKEVSIVNKEPFLNDTLIAAQSIDVTIDLMKAIKGSYDILGIDINTPRIHALVNEQGVANWNITKPDTIQKETGPSKPLSLKLRHYSIENGYIEYKDDQGKMYVTLVNLNHSGSGDFTSDNFTLSTQTDIDAVNFTYGNIAYLFKVKTILSADINIDNVTHKYTFNTDKIQLNGLKLSAKGTIQMPDTLNTIMDVQFNTPSNDFKDILSLVPGIYQNNFKDIKTSGKAAFNGFVKGTYNKTQMPAYEVNLSVENASFQYPDLPGKVSDIQIKMQAKNPDGVTDHTVVNIEKGHIAFDNEPFDFRLLLKTPVSNPWVDAAMKGSIDLSQVQKFMKLESGTKLTGLINADASVKGSIAAAQKGKYDELNAAGTIGVNNLFYSSKDYPDGVSISSLLLTFNPKNVTVSNFKGAYLQTNFTANGSIDNLLGYYLHNEALSGSLHVAADKMNVNKWMGTSGTTTANTKQTTAPSSGPFLVPANLNISLSAEVGSIQYDNLLLEAVSGTLAIHDETVYMQKVMGKALGGMLQIDGYYSTKNDKKNPDIQIAYSVQNVDVQKTYNTFVTVQKLMPIGKYLSGTLTSQLTMQGKLGADMMPVLNTLSGKGNFLLLQGILSKFAPTDELANKLGISSLRSILLKDIKTYFSFQNGRVAVDPFKFNVGDVGFEVAGSHGFDQSLDYGINMAVPRSLMGSQGNAMLNNLVNQAAGKGVKVQLPDKVNLTVKVGGTITKPAISTDLKDVAGNAVDNVKQQLVNEAQKRADSAKATLRDTAKAIKKDLMNSAKSELQNQLSGNKDTAKKKDVINNAAEKAKGALKGLFK